VLAVDRGRVLLDAGGGPWHAPLSGRLRRSGVAPTTGDFVAAVPDGPVRAVLPRRGVIARRNERGRPEVLAANVDRALLATSLNRDLNPRRLARFLALTARGGVESTVLLTKSDLVGDAAAEAAAVAAGLDGVPVLAVSTLDGTGLDALRGLLAPGRTAVLLGTSGVGKSTWSTPCSAGAPADRGDPRERRSRAPRDRPPRARRHAGRRPAHRHAGPAARRAARRRRRAGADARSRAG
jgi:ribosome biogenesis GTPase